MNVTVYEKTPQKWIVFIDSDEFVKMIGRANNFLYGQFGETEIR